MIALDRILMLMFLMRAMFSRPGTGGFCTPGYLGISRITQPRVYSGYLLLQILNHNVYFSSHMLLPSVLKLLSVTDPAQQ